MADRYASLKQGLVGAWIPSVSGSGLLLPDLSGRGNNGAIVGADSTFYVGTAKGIAISSDGTNDAFSCSPIGTGVNQVCLSTWIKIDTYNNTDDLLLEHTANYNLNNGFISDPCAGNGRWAVAISNAATLPGFTSYNYWDFARPSAGVWNHVLTYFDRTQGLSASGLRTWVNGVEQTLANSFTVGSMSGNFDATTTYFLSRATSSLFLQAQIADIRLYSRLPTIPEILLLASEPGIGFKPAKKLSRFSTRYTYKPPKAKVFEGVRVRDHDYASLRQGLVGAWCPSLPNGGSGNTLPDQSGRGNHGTLTNMGPEDWVSSGDGRALDFDGSNDNVRVAFARPAFPFTLSCWALTTTDTTNEYSLILCRSTADDGQFSILWGGGIAGDYIYARQEPDTGGGLIAARSQNAFAINKWTHVVAVFRSNTYRQIYVDAVAGVEDATNVATPSVDRLAIGRFDRPTPGGAFLGQIDDCRVYSRELTEPEIRLLASRRGIGLQPSPTRFIAREKKTGLRRKILTGQT